MHELADAGTNLQALWLALSSVARKGAKM